MKEKSTSKNFAAPLTFLCIRCDFSNIEDFNSLLNFLKTIYSPTQLKSIPTSFIQEAVDPETAKIPEYLDYSKPYRTYREKARYQSSMVLFIFNQHAAMSWQLFKED